MTAEGPRYPDSLQAKVDHAERFARILLEMETKPEHASKLPAWIIGRASEVERFVEAVTHAWRCEEHPPETAASALEAYLVDLHAGLAARLGVADPACCGDESSSVARSARAEPSALIESIDRLLVNLESGGAPTTTSQR